MEKPYKICFLGYRKLSEIARQVIDTLDLPDTEVILKECNFLDISETVSEAISSGYDIFIAGSANAAEFANRSYGHLVEIKVELKDYIKSIRKAIRLGGKHLAIVSYSLGGQEDLQLLTELSPVPIDIITYEDSSELADKIRSTEAEVIIGASFACELADTFKKQNVLVYVGKETIYNTILQARQLAVELQRETRKSETISAIVDQSPSGIIVTDEKGKITTINRSARSQTNLFASHLRGRELGDLIPVLSYDSFIASGQQQLSKIHLINGAMIRCTQTRISSGRTDLGMLVTLFPDNSRKKKNEFYDPALFRARNTWKDMICNSPAMAETVEAAKAFCSIDHPVMITGEAGSGKSFLAQCIHNGSSRSDQPYIVINTAAYSAQDAARTLFGFEDSNGVHPGLFDLAGTGTVVLQNLSGACQALQSCILQVLTEKYYFHLGGTRPVPFQAFVITIAEESDRALVFNDLWQRLSVFSVRAPSLRERQEDILPLFLSLLLNEDISYRSPHEEFIRVLNFYPWPGNIVELSGVCKRYALLLRQTSNVTASAKHLMLIRAIGEDALLGSILERYPALKSPSETSSAEIIEGVDTLKRIMRYSNTVISQKLNLSRTTLWRLQKASSRAEESFDN